MGVRLREWRERWGPLGPCSRATSGRLYLTVVRIETGRISPTVAMFEKLAMPS
jgi:hypothetical protein